MRLTTRTNLAMRTLMFCAVNQGRIVRRQEVAAVCNASENHLAQVIHLLAQKKFLRTIRGRAGGLMLGRAPANITVGEVFRAFEAPLPFAECFAGDANQCPLFAAGRLLCQAGRGDGGRPCGRELRPAVHPEGRLSRAQQQSRSASPDRIGQSGRASPAQACTRSASVACIARSSSIFAAIRARCRPARSFTSALARPLSS